MRPKVGVGLPALAFILSAAEVLAVVCQDAFFLRYNPEERIPLAIAGGGVAAALGSIFLSKLHGRHSSRFLACAVCIAMASLVVPVALWTRSGTAGNTFFQFVFLEMAQFLVAASAWAFIQAPLDPAGARRILPRTMLAYGIGGLVGGLLIPLWLRGGSLTGILFLAALAWLAAAAVIAFMKHGTGPAPGGPPRGERGLTRILFGDPLARRTVALISLLVLVILVLESRFKATIQDRFDENGIATYEGLLLGGSAILGLPFALIFSERIFGRLGVHWALVLLPILLAIGLGAFLLVGHLTVVAAVLLADRTLKPTLHEPAEGCLVGALDPQIRGRFKLLLDGVVIPCVSVLGAIALVVGGGGRATSLVTVVAIILALTYAFSAVLMKPAYAEALRGLLAQRRFDPEVRGSTRGWIPVLDATALNAVLKALDDGSEWAAAMAEEILLEYRFPEERRAMTVRLHHANPRVRCAALRWFVREAEPPPDPASLSPAAEGLSDTERALRLAVRLRAGLADAPPLLASWSASADPADRRRAAEAAAHAGAGPALATLLRDPEPEIRRIALSSGPECADPRVLEATVAALEDEKMGKEAVGALVRWGPACVPLLRQRIERDGPARLLALRIFGFIRDPDAVATLWQYTEKRETSDEAISALVRLRSLWPEGVMAPPGFDATVRAEVELGHRLAEVLVSLPPSLPPRSLLRRETSAQLTACLERTARRLQLLGPPREIWTIFLCLLDPKSPDRDTAMELLRLCLPPGELLANAERLFTGQIVDPKIADFESAKKWIAEHGDAWLRSAAHHDLGIPFEGEDPMKGVLDKVLFLREVRLFSGVDNRDLVLLAEVAEEVEVPEGHMVCKTGEVGDALWVIREGYLRVLVQGKEVARLARGECVGETAVLEGGARRTADVVAIHASRLLKFSADAFRGLLEAHPPIMWGLVRLLLKRIKQATSGDIRTLYDMATGAP